MREITADQTESIAGTENPKPEVRGVLASLSLSMMLAALGTSIANVGLPTLTSAFNASFQEVQWVVLAYLLSITTLIVSVGRLGDIIGRRRLLLAGIVLFTVASIICGIATKLWLLIAARAVQGVGAAIMMALSLAFVGATVSKTKTGSAMGLLGATSAIGTALGPSLGGFLIFTFGWRALFLAGVPLGILAFLFACRYVPVDIAMSKENRAPFDYLGTLLLGLALAGYALAMTVGRGAFGPINVTLLLVAGICLRLFMNTERKVASPLVNLAMFLNPLLTGSLAMSALVSTVMMATLVVGPFYLSRALGLDAASVGFLLSVGPMAAALTGVPAGRIVDRYGAHRGAIVGLAGIGFGASMLAAIAAGLGISGYVVSIVLMTSSYALFQTANNTGVMSDISVEQRGALAGLLNLSRNLGLITGASVMGAVFSFASTTIDITRARPEAVVIGMRTTFALALFLILIAMVIGIRSRSFASVASQGVGI